MILAVGVLAMAYLSLDRENKPEQGIALGDIISWIIILQIVINIVVILYGLLYKAKLHLKRAYGVWKLKRYFEKHMIEAGEVTESEDTSSYDSDDV